MDEKIRITLSSTDENLATLYPNKTDTVRSVLKSAKIVSPPNSQIICFLKKLQLKLDLSLAIQGVEDNDTIYVFHKKISRTRHRKYGKHFDVFASLCQKSHQLSRRKNSVFIESLKLYDHSCFVFDYNRNSAKIYSQLLKQQEEKFVIKEAPTEQLNLDCEIKEHVSCDPLPICFKSNLNVEENGDNDSLVPHVNRFRDYSNVMNTHDETNLQS